MIVITSGANLVGITCGIVMFLARLSCWFNLSEGSFLAVFRWTVLYLCCSLLLLVAVVLYL